MQNHMKEGRVQMYTVTHIYEADFGCEERADGAKQNAWFISRTKTADSVM